jgi:cytochrome c-type biogenesis protein
MHTPAPRLPLSEPAALINGARRWGPSLLALLLLVALLVAYVRGQSLAAPVEPAAQPAAAEAVLGGDEVTALLLRKGVGPGQTALEVFYAPTWYFTWSGRALPETDRPAMAFILMELIHRSELNPAPPAPLLEIEGRAVAPLSVQIVTEADHHRVALALYPAGDEAGRPLVGETTASMALLMPGQDAAAPNPFVWSLPLPYGLGVVGEADAMAGHQHGAAPAPLPQAGQMSGPLAMALLGGMLSALTPCLLQLAAYYTAILAGTRAGTDERARARRQVLRVGLFFIGGFAVVYTLGGLLAGFAGESLQRLGSLEAWVRPSSIAAGVVILVMALRMALQADAPLVCKLPMGRLGQGETGWRGSLVMGVTFAVGCLSCFSATVLSVLLVYAGALGSPLMGAGLLLVFSLGVGLVFVLAAWLATWVTPLMDALYRYRRLSGTLSALVMAAFGLLMITDTFHIVSGYITLLIERF